MTTPLHRIYNLHSDVARFRLENNLSETNPLEIPEVVKAVDQLFTELVNGVPENLRDGLIRLGQHCFFRIGRPGGDKAIAEWITTVEQAARRETERLIPILEGQVRELHEPARIGRAQQERARAIRRRHDDDGVYLQAVLEAHEIHPDWPYSVVRTHVGKHLGVHPDTVKKYVPRKPW